jgi:hypothetical protein
VDSQGLDTHGSRRSRRRLRATPQWIGSTVPPSICCSRSSTSRFHASSTHRRLRNTRRATGKWIRKASPPDRLPAPGTVAFITPIPKPRKRSRKNEDGTETLENGPPAAVSQHDEHGNPLPRPSTLLIDSEQIESGEVLDDRFRAMAAPGIARFRREIMERTGDLERAENVSDQELLREVMNTVGKTGR